jgi:hypothetical protein
MRAAAMTWQSREVKAMFRSCSSAVVSVILPKPMRRTSALKNSRFSGLFRLRGVRI